MFNKCQDCYWWEKQNGFNSLYGKNVEFGKCGYLSLHETNNLCHLTLLSCQTGCFKFVCRIACAKFSKASAKFLP